MSSLTTEPVRVIMFAGETRVGVIRDRDGQVEATVIGAKYRQLGLFTTRDAAVRAVLRQATPPP